MDKYTGYIDELNNDDANIRLEALRKLAGMLDSGELQRPAAGCDVNNHIHTTYSFSPYSPAKALWMAYNAGLMTAGIMDHDSICGAREFIEAGKIIGMATTIGVECRVDFSSTLLSGKLINNPDQKSIAYVTLHGVPHTQIDTVRTFFTPYIAERNKRNSQMVDRINEMLKPFGIQLDFVKDIVPLSNSSDGGTITERHISYGLSKMLVEKYGRGEKLVSFLKDSLKVNVSSKLEGYLQDSGNQFYEYDLLGLIKSDVISRFYIAATTECPDVREVTRLAEDIGAISAYAYLGDVGDSVTGDKKTQKFEDDYIELLFDVIKDLGFNAVTYMPSRNSMEQLRRVKSLCGKHGFFQISGEDINSPRQSFLCPAMRNAEFDNLIESTWALIGHERAATEDIKKAMFSDETAASYPDLKTRVAVYKAIGMQAK